MIFQEWPIGYSLNLDAIQYFKNKILHNQRFKQS